MTKVANIPSVGPDRPSPDETKITPAMLKAGSNALEDFYMGEGLYDLRAQALEAVFREMDAARKLSG
jgi:hypothetical protein